MTVPKPRLRSHRYTPIHTPDKAGLFYGARWDLILRMSIFIPCAGLIGFLMARLLAGSADLANAPLRSGSAAVLNKSLVKLKTTSSAMLTFRLLDHVVIKSSIDKEKWMQTHIGDTVPMTYRVGKSGTIYIEDWQPSEPKHL